MSTLDEIKRAICRLNPEELATLRQWFDEWDAEAWDRQIEEDAAAGRLNVLVDEALRYLRDADSAGNHTRRPLYPT